MSSHQYSHMDTSGVSSRHSSASRPPTMSTFGHGPTKNDSDMSSFQRNTNPKHSNTHNVRHPVPNQFHGSNPKIHRLHSEHYPPNQRPNIDIPRAPSDAHVHKSHILDHDRNLHRSRNLNLSRPYDDTLESCNTTVRDDDDVTTTSGSYTINPDELCNEIDELFFKPSDTVV